jgi:regulator of replication initiation timing
MDLDYENAPLDPPEVEEIDELPQKIELAPDAIINQLMRRYSGQLQQQTWENTLLATENEQLKTMLAEAANETQEDKATIAELSSMLDERQGYAEELEVALSQRTPVYLDSDGHVRPAATPSDDPPPEVDGFLAMAAGQPGLASTPAPAES